MRLIFYSAGEMKFIMVRFNGFSSYSTFSLARSSSNFQQVACSDNYQTTLSCVIMKTSGELCQVDFRLEVSSFSGANANIGCRIAKFYDFDNSVLNVVDNFLVVAGKFLTSNTKRALVFKANQQPQWPIFASGGIDFSTLDIRGDMIVMTAEKSTFVGGVAAIVQSHRKLTLFKLNNMTVKAPNEPYFEDLASGKVQLTQYAILPKTDVPMDLFFRKKISITILTVVLLLVLVGLGCLILSYFLISYYREELNPEQSYQKTDKEDQEEAEKKKNKTEMVPPNPTPSSPSKNGVSSSKENPGSTQKNGASNSKPTNGNATINQASASVSGPLGEGKNKLVFAEKYDPKTGVSTELPKLHLKDEPKKHQEVPKIAPVVELIKIKPQSVPESVKTPKADLVVIKGPGKQNIDQTSDFQKLEQASKPPEKKPEPPKVIETHKPVSKPVEAPKLVEPPKPAPKPVEVPKPVEPPKPTPKPVEVPKSMEPPKPVPKPVEAPKPTPKPVEPPKPNEPPKPSPKPEPPKPSPKPEPPKPTQKIPEPPKPSTKSRYDIGDDMTDFSKNDFNYDYDDMKDFSKDDLNFEDFDNPSKGDKNGKGGKKKYDEGYSMSDFSKNDLKL